MSKSLHIYLSCTFYRDGKRENLIEAIFKIYFNFFFCKAKTNLLKERERKIDRERERERVAERGRESYPFGILCA